MRFPLRGDLRYAIRGLRRRPLFTLLAATTLALGIGATATIFSVVYATLLRRLPFPEPDRLARVSLTIPASGEDPARDDLVWSFPKWRTFAEEQTRFKDLAIYTTQPMTLLQGDEAERLESEVVSGRYLGLLGVSPVAGRSFSPEEDAAPGAPRVVVLGHALWQRRFNGEGSVVGRSVQLDGLPATVIGIAPEWFRGLGGRAELWVNVASGDAQELGQRWSHTYYLLGRLRDGVSFAQARASTERLGRVVDEAHPSPFAAPGAEHLGATLRPLDAVRVDRAVGQSVVALAVAVALVLLLACVNLASLLLARSVAREREIALRLALGAHRRDLVRQLLTEAGVLAGLGGAAGLGVAALGILGLRRFWTWLGGAVGSPSELTEIGMRAIRMDPAVLVFTVVTTVVTSLLVGLLPALRATRPDLTRALKEGAPQGAGRGPKVPLRDGLVVVELALAVVLLVGAGLTLRSLGRLVAVDVGIRPENVLTVRLAITSSRYQRDSAAAFYGELVERASGLPGVERAAIGNCPPLAGGCNGTIIWFRDRPPVPEGTEPSVGVHHVSPDWFSTLGVPLLRGRVFTDADRIGSPKVVIINQTAARRFWPNEDPIGKPIAVGQGGFHDRAEVIGIVGNVRFGTAVDPSQPDVFLSYLQSPRSTAMLFLRASTSTPAVVGRVRELVRELDPSMPVYEMRSMTDRVRRATVRERFTSGVLTGFAGMALLLAAIGVYALIAHEVARRTREIGIRMTLGAKPGTILALVLRRGALLAGLGLLIGVGAALGLARLLGSLLYQVEPSDPGTYLMVGLVLATAALLATLAPAIRATHVQPMEAIRTE